MKHEFIDALIDKTLYLWLYNSEVQIIHIILMARLCRLRLVQRLQLDQLLPLILVLATVGIIIVGGGGVGIARGGGVTGIGYNS